jgi:hypothetical protein
MTLGQEHAKLLENEDLDQTDQLFQLVPKAGTVLQRLSCKIENVLDAVRATLLT